MPSNQGALAPTPVPQVGLPNATLVRQALEGALDDWWREGTLPPLALVRDSLLLLEAGDELDDAQRSLLLRAAIDQRKGMLTALRHQTDPARTALILADALLQPENPLTPDEAEWLRFQDSRAEAWYPALRELLQEERGAADIGRAARAQAVLARLEGAAWLAPLAGEGVDGVPLAGEGAAPRRRRTWLRAFLAIAAIAAVVALVSWQQQQARMQELVVIPGGAYPPAGEMAAFAVDRSEVTVAAYRRCAEQGACPWPVSNASATRDSYLLDPAFAQYPVLNVTWDAASRYCTWTGKRLPTVDEWEVAAGFAPATQRRYRYPWGDQFEIQAANSAPAGVGDTLTVRSYHPIGDSPFGASDMAGNVAEWTATAADDGYIVKGGSFQDGAAAVDVAARQMVPVGTAVPWLGFRCAATLAPGVATTGN